MIATYGYGSGGQGSIATYGYSNGRGGFVQTIIEIVTLTLSICRSITIQLER